MWSLISRNPRFTRYWIALLGMEFAEWIRNMVLTYAVYDISHGSAKAVSFVLLCQFIPVFAGPFIGVLADRWDRQRTYIISLAIQGLLLIGITLTLRVHVVGWLYVGALLSAAATVFSQTAAAGYLLQFVPRDDRQTATALQQIVFSVMMLLGPPLGTAVYVAIKQWSLAVAGVLFLMAVLLNLTIHVAHDAQASDSNFTYLQDLRRGIAYARANWVMRIIVITGLLVGCSAGILNVLEIFLVTKFLHLPKTWLSVLLFVQGGGMLLSTPILNKLKVAMKKLLPLSLLWFGIGMLLMISMHHWWLTLAGYLVFSIGNVAANMAVGTLLKTDVEETFQGRMSALFNTAYGLMTGIFMIITGQLQAVLGVRVLIGGSSVLIICSSAVLFFITMRHLKQQATIADADYVEEVGV